MRDSAQHISSLRRHNVFHDMVTQIWPVQMQANHSGYHNGILLTFHVKQNTIASFRIVTNSLTFCAACYKQRC